MILMDIYDWINSKDIAEYNRKMGHTFNTVESAFLVWQCERHTMDERFTAWNEITETMQDMVMEKRLNMDRFESAHEFIRSYTSLLRNKISEFYDESLPAVWFRETLYKREFYGGAEPAYEKDDCVYSSYGDCYDNAVKEEKANDCFDDITRLRITKKYIGSHQDVPGEIVFEFDREGTLLRDFYFTVDDADMPVAMAFEGMWIDIPVPFKRNDLVCVKTELSSCRPAVLDRTANQPTDGFPQARIDRLSLDRDFSDMGYTAYFLDDKGTLFHDYGHNYQNLEYYREELEGNDRILLWLRRFLQGEIDIEEFALIEERIQAEEFLKSHRSVYASELMKI